MRHVLPDDARARKHRFSAHVTKSVYRLASDKKRVKLARRFYGIEAVLQTEQESRARVAREYRVKRVCICNSPDSGRVARMKYYLAHAGKRCKPRIHSRRFWRCVMFFCTHVYRLT